MSMQIGNLLAGHNFCSPKARDLKNCDEIRDYKVLK
jgi:hypothetical protein